MKTFYIFLFTLVIIANTQGQEISSLKLNTTSQVLIELMDTAINDDRKDLVAIYYSTYQAIKLEHATTEKHDQYFNEVKEAYESEIGRWVIGLESPPEEHFAFLNSQIPCPKGPESVKDAPTKKLQISKKVKTLNTTEKDLEQPLLLKVQKTKMR